MDKVRIRSKAEAIILGGQLLHAAQEFTGDDKLAFFGETLAALSYALCVQHNVDPVSFQIALLHRVGEAAGCDVEDIITYQETTEDNLH